MLVLISFVMSLPFNLSKDCCEFRSSKGDVFSRASSERHRRKVTKEVKRKDKIYLERERWENHFDPCVQLFGFYVEIQEHVNLASS